MDALLATVGGLLVWLLVLTLPILIWLGVSYAKRREVRSPQSSRERERSDEIKRAG